VATTTPWRSCGHDCHVVIIATSLLRARQCAGQGRVKARAGCARSGRDVGYVGRIGKAMRVVAVARPQTRRGVILGDEAPTRHGLRDLLLRTMKMGL
jgi:hypothetical protein